MLRALAILVMLAAPAAADIGFTWDAPATCPDAGTVRARIAQRLGDAGDVAGIVIAITRTHGRYEAAIVVGDETRTLVAPRCDDLADAVAVIAARLALARKPVEVAAVAPEPPEIEMPAVRATPATDGEWPFTSARHAAGERWGGGARVLALSGVGAVPAVGVGAEVAGFVRRDQHFLEVAGSRWASGRVLLHEGAPGSVDVGLDVLAVRLGWGPSRLPIRAWLGGEYGAMNGRGVALGDSRAGSSRWVAADGGFGVAWPMFPNARLVGTFEVAIPVERPRFVLDDGSLIYQPALVNCRVAFGLELGWK